MRIIIFCCLTIVNLSYAETDIIFKSSFDEQICNNQMQCCQGAVIFQENFNIANQGWNGYNQWSESGNEVTLAEIVNNQARLIPQSSIYSLARMIHPVATRNAEATFSLFFENALTQGVGFYMRSNGGYLQQTNPTGQGYGVFVEKFSEGRPGIGLWYENNGDEISFIRYYDPSYVINDETEYRVRFQVFQEDVNNTRLRARFWQVGTTEPSEWQVSVLDNFAPLQNTTGGILVDSWSNQKSGAISDAIRVDDIEITQLCNPVLKYTTPVTIANNLQFAEGPVWNNDRLLFSDIDANTINQWQPLTGVTVVNSNSNNANGLAYDNQNRLLAAENADRRISIDDGTGSINLVDNYQGNSFNSPNDIAVSSTGVIYFTDPDYGLAGRVRELGFHGVFRLHPTLGLFAEYQGDISTSRPNGIAMSPNQQTLYWNDTQAGQVLQMQVGADGALTNLSLFAENLTIPDGMCIDNNGNVFVATWNSGLEVYAGNGDYWGRIPMPEISITNCTFGEDNNEVLFVTGRNNLYRLQAPVSIF